MEARRENVFRGFVLIFFFSKCFCASKHFNDSFLNEMPTVDEIGNAEIVHLEHNQISTIDRAYPTVEYLNLSFNRISSLHLTDFAFPMLKILDLTGNPIEYVHDDFFTEKIFPRLEFLRLRNALTHLNPFLIGRRWMDFSSLKFLTEIDLSENEFEEFSCSNVSTHLRWKLSSSIVRFSLARNKIELFDSNCLKFLDDLQQFDLHSNYLENWSGAEIRLGNLRHLELQSNFFSEFAPRFFEQFPNLIELDLSKNPLRFERRADFLPKNIEILSLNSIKSDFPCRLFESTRKIRILNLIDFPRTNIDSCLLRKLTSLKKVSRPEKIEPIEKTFLFSSI